MTKPKTPEWFADYIWTMNLFDGRKEVIIADITKGLKEYGDQQYNKGLEDAACQAENKTKMLSCSTNDHGVPDAIRKLKREEK